MTCILLRHGDKQSGFFQGNPPLTAKGELQALALAKLVKSHLLPVPNLLYASSKIRSQQTLDSVAKELRIPVIIKADLDERRDQESMQDFRARVKNFITSVEKSKGPLFMCSHYDWIEEAMSLIPCDHDLTDSKFNIWSTGTYFIFEIQDGLWHLQQTGHL